METLRFSLTPDKKLPMFQRLEVDRISVSIRDILEEGIHPWVNGKDHCSLAEALVKMLNKPKSAFPELDEQGYCNDLMEQHGYLGYEKKTVVDRTVEHIQETIYFADDLDYLKLLELARQRLRDRWSHSVARELARAAFYGFQDLRQFLKSKDGSIKLSGYGDIDSYDLGEVLSVDDFAAFDRILIEHGIPGTTNFRKASCLGLFTDGAGRLKLVERIDELTLTQPPQKPDYVPRVWRVSRHDNGWRFRPDIGKSPTKKRAAKAFAKQWRKDDGALCFTTSLERLSEMVKEGVVMASLPSLNYRLSLRAPLACAEVRDARIEAFTIGRFPNYRWSGGDLKEILREFGVPMTGNKEVLLGKLAKLAAEQYEEHRRTMDRFFKRHRFLRIAAVPPKAEKLDLLQDKGRLANLLLVMYAAKHLRGNAILEPTHDNNTYSVEELAHALVCERVGVGGSFLRVG